jgi:outer membrane receptor protein involved in Fe transport
MTKTSRCLWAAAVLFAAQATVFAQGNPTGAVSGQVVDPEGLALPGVTITAQSPALQGVRTTTTSGNGDYIIPFLPPGMYTLSFELEGFQTGQRTVQVEIAATIPLDVKLALATLTETVQVTGVAATEIAQTATVASTYKSDLVDKLPLGRTLQAATLLAPGVNDNGPGGNIMVSGALSYENLNLVNGVVINENLRGQARNLFIEDAIQETKVSTGSISAEYGRFQGGVINSITKSGSNVFSGSFRISFTNDSWSSLTPYPGDQNIDDTVPVYEATLGGPIFKDKLWFFGAGRYEKGSQNITTSYTAFNYAREDEEKRYEGKLTYAINQRNTAKVSYIKRRLDTKNNNFGTIMDARSLYDNANDENLLSVNYTSVLTNKLFVEGQYSARELLFLGSGSQFTDIARGTPIWDRSRGSARFNSPTFCAVCGSGKEERSNWNAFGKASYFLSTQRLGSHSLVAGFDTFKETRKNDNYQSGTSYRIQATRTIINGTDIYPVFTSDGNTYIDYLPLVNPSVGNDIRTYSFFLNDQWRLNDRFSFNIGVRYDKNSSKDQSGFKVVDDDAFSPRFGLTWDVMGDGKWRVNAGLARYVVGVNTAIVDAGSSGGRTATFSYRYQGPAINTSATGPYLTAEQALPLLFEWFNANGGTSRTTRTAPSIPGVTTKVADGIKAPNSDEYSIGIAREIGNKGAVRLDYVYRNYRDFYGDFRDTTTGKVTDPNGRSFDLVIVDNTNSVDRSYKGLSGQVSYRLTRDMQVGGNYTLSWARGNFEGEDSGSGPVRASANDFPEYRQESWNFPVGYTNGDQRHKLRGWFNYALPVPAGLGRIDVGLLQRFDSSTGYDNTITLDPRSYVTNPGYLSPTSSVTYYLSERGELRRDGIFRTDLSLNWTHKLPGLTKGQVFFRGVVTNLFNHQRVDGFNTTILRRDNNSAYAAFNPFTETPVQGVHWDFGPEYGKVTGPGSYQTPREAYFSVGFRF